MREEFCDSCGAVSKTGTQTFGELRLCSTCALVETIDNPPEMDEKQIESYKEQMKMADFLLRKLDENESGRDKNTRLLDRERDLDFESFRRALPIENDF